MSVQFDEQSFTQTQYQGFDQPKGLSGKLISWGIAKDQSGANTILVVLLVLILIFTGFVMFGPSGNNEPTSGDIPLDQFVP